MKPPTTTREASPQALAEAFEALLARTRGGAAFCAIADGRVVVDLAGGWADPAQTRPWERDTTATVFSGSKGLVAMCLALLVDRGELELDAPVSRWWPEFAAAGKESITVRDVATHQAGLPALSATASADDLGDPAGLTASLAAQPCDPELRGVPCYHPLTFGWLCAELVRRIGGLPFAEFFRREIAEPAGADVRFGVPQSDQARVAEAFGGETWEVNQEQIESPEGRLRFGEPSLWYGDPLGWNLPQVRAAEIPGAGAIGTAEGMARCYAAFGGGLDGVPALVSPATLELFAAEQYDVLDPAAGEPMRYGVGFQLQIDRRRFYGPPADAFGHGGAGGSIHGWWPSQRVAFSFVMNEMREETGDTRGRELLRALHDCLGARGEGAS